MAHPISRFFMATGAAAAVTTGAMIPRPASADTTSTLLTAAAAIGAVVLLGNYEHKQAAANQIVGYTRNGGTVYGDGRIVMPDGQTFYPNANGQNPNQYVYGNGYAPNYAYGNAPAYSYNAPAYGYNNAPVYRTYGAPAYNNLPRYTVPGYARRSRGTCPRARSATTAAGTTTAAATSSR